MYGEQICCWKFFHMCSGCRATAVVRPQPVLWGGRSQFCSELESPVERLSDFISTFLLLQPILLEFINFDFFQIALFDFSDVGICFWCQLSTPFLWRIADIFVTVLWPLVNLQPAHDVLELLTCHLRCGDYCNTMWEVRIGRDTYSVPM